MKRTEKEIELIDDQISILNDQIILNKNKLEVEKSEGIVKSVYSTIPETALTFAFWVWFGVLSFIVSITGTMLAFASLTLRDRELIKKKIIKKNWFILVVCTFFIIVDKKHKS